MNSKPRRKRRRWRGRRVNLKFTLRILISLVLLSAGVVSVHAFQIQRNAGIFKRQAQQAEEAKRFDAAERYYRLYLGYAPGDNGARIAWARALEKKVLKSSQDLIRIFEIYETIIRVEPEQKEIRRKLVDIAFALSRHSDAQEHIDRLLGGFSTDESDPDRLQALGKLEQLRATCVVARNDNPMEAIAYYQKAIEHAPRHLASYVQLAEVYSGVGNTAAFDGLSEADKIMQALVKANEGDYQAHLARARHLRQRNKIEEMGAEIERAYQLASDKPETILAKVEWAQLCRKPDDTRKYLEKGLQVDASNAGFYLALAQLEISAHRLDNAVSQLRTGLNKAPAQNKNALRHMLALCLLQRREQTEVEKIIETMIQTRAPQSVVDELHARILMSNGRWTEAATILERTKPLVAADANAAARVHELLGFCYEKRNEPDRAQSAYRQALAANPRLMIARAGAAGALFKLGRAEDALAEYQALASDDPSAWTKVAQLLIRRNLRVEKTKRDWPGVDKALAEAAKAQPDSTEVLLVRMQALLAGDRSAQARELIEESCKAQPAKMELWLARADLMGVLDRKPEKALAILKEAEEQIGDRVELRLARAWYWKQGEAGAGEKTSPALHQQEENTDHFTPEDRQRLLRGLGDIYYRTDGIAEAKRLWRQVAALQPHDLQVRLALFDLAVREDDRAAVEQILAAIKELDSDGTVWRFAKASGILADARKGDKTQLGKARELLLEVVRRRSHWGAPLRELAVIEDLEGNTQRALENYEQAIDLGDRNPLALRRTIQLLWNQQRYTEAGQVLQKVDAQGTLPLEWRRVQAAVHVQAAEYDHAIALARQAISNGSQEPRDYVWLGQVLWSAGYTHYYMEAESILRQATQLPGADAMTEPWVALVQLLAKTNRKDKATAVIEQARGKLPTGVKALALAQCYEAIDEFAKAAEEFDAALKMNPGDVLVLRNVAGFYLRRGQWAMAEPYLKKIIDPAARAIESDQMWARRSLAMRPASFRSYQDYKESLALVQENTRHGGTIDDLQALAVLKAQHPSTRREAISILEDLRARRPATLDELRTLAELYEAVRDWPKARSTFNILAANSLSATQANLGYAALSVRALLRHEEAGDARIWVGKMIEREPDSLQTLDLRVRVLKAENQSSAAVELLQKYVQKSDSILEVAATLFDAIDQPALAEEAYRKWVGQSSDYRRACAFAVFLGRQDKVDEALSLCERAAQAGALELAAGAGRDVLHECKNPSDQQFQRVERLLQEAAKKNPRSLLPLLQLAELRNLEQKYTDAETIYRDVLDKNSRSVVALNNLAWLLAVRGEKLDEAMQHVSLAMSLAGEIGPLLDTRALIYIKLGALKDAVKDLKQAIQDEETASRYFHLAQALRLSNRKEAISNLRRARELNRARTKIHPLERKAYDELLEALDEK